MRITSSFGVEIRKPNSCIHQTMKIYRAAVGYLIRVLDSVWEELDVIKNPLEQFNTAEHMVHNTKDNRARFDFDRLFYKMPSYLRRSAIQSALGSLSSYHTNLEIWEEGRACAAGAGKAVSGEGRPVLAEEPHAMPVFYHDIMYKEGEAGSDTAFLKLYNGHDWGWKEVRLLHTDMEYIRKHWSGKKASAPTLEKRRKKFYLRFSYTEAVSLSKVPAEEQTACAVDLGINTDAVCTIMQSDGTVLARKFISFPSEKDRLKHVLGRISRFQREHAGSRCPGLWSYAVRLNDELSIMTARAITAFAAEHGADVIIFEHLDMQGRVHGSKKQRLHMWKKRDVQKRCEHMAHRKGMRISRVCAWNTSRLAYDGSGKVKRDPENHSLCRFDKGKQYNCDLSASYNIGARYFIRERIKPLPATVRSLLEAKVPAVKRRTSCVYADLLAFDSVIRGLYTA